jgi:homoserine O-acetyltransferase
LEQRKLYGPATIGTRFASVFYGIATTGGTLAYQKLDPTREAADKVLENQR